MDNKEIGNRIKQLRLAQNLTQQQLADKLHYKSRSTINKIELGINELHPTKLREFAHALNTTIEYLLGFVENTNSCGNKIEIHLEDYSVINYTLNTEDTNKVIEFIDNLEKK